MSDKGYNPSTAMLIVKMNKIKCCARCENYNSYYHDLGAEWDCDEGIEIELEMAINAYKSRECNKFELNKDENIEE
jgi:hypothetical protein